MASFCSYKVVIMTWAILLILVPLAHSSSANLDPNYYSGTCRNVSNIVEEVVNEAIKAEARMGASLLRLHFHDCFVNGCDGSVLLDDTAKFTGEKNANPNKNSLRGFKVIDQIKKELEINCRGVVSCADILAIAAMKSVKRLGGPSWDVKLGRRDARNASQSDANKFLPSPNLNFMELLLSFQKQGLSKQELVVLSGAHTVGKARCSSFRDHIYNDTNVNQQFAEHRKLTCKFETGNTDNRLARLDPETPYIFDNQYFLNLEMNMSLLHSDQEIKKSELSHYYSKRPGKFQSDFGDAMIKMGDIKPLTGSNREIRKHCRWVN